jgi:hypothetical protein
MVVGSSFFIPGCNPPTLFEAIDQSLDLTPQPIQGSIKWPRSLLIAFPRNRHADPMPPQVLPNCPTAIALVADEPTRAPLRATWATTFDLTLFHQRDKHGSLMPLPWGEQPGQGLAIALGPQMDFGTEAALTAP